MDELFVQPLGAALLAPYALLVAVFVLGGGLCIEGGKEQVLQYGLVIVAFTLLFVRGNIQQAGKCLLIKMLARYQLFFLEELNENQPCEQADHRNRRAASGGWIVGFIQRLAFGKAHPRFFA